MKKGTYLTQKQEKFCLKYVETGNASEAYRYAYNYTSNLLATLNNNAYKLLKRNDIMARIEELKQMAIDEGIITILERKKLLTKICESTELDAQGNKRFQDAMKAIDILNKMESVYVERSKTELSGEIGIAAVVELPIRI